MLEFMRSFLLLIIWVTILPTQAQLEEQIRPRALRQSVRVEHDDDQGRITLARSLIRDKNYHGASAILEGLYEADPDNDVVQNLLLTCYLQLEYYAKAETLTRRRIERAPANLSYQLALAEVLTRQGKEDEGLAAYKEALTLIRHRDGSLYLLVVRSMIGQGFEVQALELIDTARVKTGDPRLFAFERGSILESQEEYSRASEEFLLLMTEDTTASARNAERRLMALLAFPQSSPEVEKVLLAWAEETASAEILKLLTSHCLKANRFDDAFQFALRQDSLERSQGQSLLQYMQQCRERKAYQPAVRMGEYFLRHYPQSQAVGDVLFGYAEALRETARISDAIAVYEEIVSTHRDTQAEADALWGIGWIYYQYVGNCGRALAYFDSVAGGQTRGMSYLKAQKQIPYCYLRLGELQEAEEGFENLSRLNVNDDIAEETDYNLAMIKLFRKQYDSAEVALRKLMVDYPRGFYVNDALGLVLLLSEAEKADELLDDFSGALFSEQRLLFDSTRGQLERVAGADNQALADVALFRLSELELDQGDTLKALAFIDRLSEEFPDSYYLPYGMKSKADILLRDADRKEEATALYRHLLKNYPNYPFISGVRQRLRELETDRKIG